MSLPLILSGAIEPRLTVDGLRNLIQDLRKTPAGVPKAIMVSEYDRRELNQDLMAGSTTIVARDDQRPEADLAAIGVIEGVMIMAHPDISRGKARLSYSKPGRPMEQPSTGRIYVGA